MDYGREPQIGVFITPSLSEPRKAVDLAVLADRSGVDLVTFQDHPYQPKFYDAWTLLSYVAALTSRVHLSGNVHNLALRPPAVLARAGASLDVLSGGRFEMGLGAGAFPDPVAAMGGPRRTPGEARRGLDEAIQIMRQMWDTGSRGGVHVRGSVYTVDGAKRGPVTPHPIQIWVGAYGPRMLELVGRACDGWLPSESYVDGGLAGLAPLQAAIDDSARAAGREPSAIRRILNTGGAFAVADDTGASRSLSERFASMILEHGVTDIIYATDDARTIEHLGQHIAPEVRALVAAARGK